MDDLLAFLRAQLDDDERVALAIQGDRYGDNDDGRWRSWTIDEHDDRRGPYLGALGVELVHSYADNTITPQRGEHIARWDPARVLAEVEAKRRILDLTDFDAQFPDAAGGYDTACDDVITLLSQPYAGRPGWREEWRA